MTKRSSTALKPRLLDLFCGAGGAAMGYHQAGFDVVGVDIKPQPNYPYTFIQSDVFEFLHSRPMWEWIIEFDAIHASPPCQAFTAYRRKGHGVGDGYPDLIEWTRQDLGEIGLRYVIENVQHSPLVEPVTLCGSMFGLDVRRHRLFETNWPLGQPACNHAAQKANGKRFPGATNRDGRYTVEVGVWRIPLAIQQAAMGIDWMTLEELTEAIPPAYTEWIGSELFAHFESEVEAAA